MATIGSLVVNLEADVEGLKKGLDNATALATNAARRMQFRVAGGRMLA